jgi:hypothetical protein
MSRVTEKLCDHFDLVDAEMRTSHRPLVVSIPGMVTGKHMVPFADAIVNRV